jgi:hypothetical protein
VIIYAQSFDVLRTSADKSDDASTISIASVAKAWYAWAAQRKSRGSVALFGRQSPPNSCMHACDNTVFALLSCCCAVVCACVSFMHNRVCCHITHILFRLSAIAVGQLPRGVGRFGRIRFFPCVVRALLQPLLREST